jgi:hypothetical protein
MKCYDSYIQPESEFLSVKTMRSMLCSLVLTPLVPFFLTMSCTCHTHLDDF